MKTQHMNAIDIFPWSDNFNTGLAEVDQQHRKLAELLNRLASQVAYEAHTQALGEIFDELADYAVYHFKTEEAIWHTYFASSSEEQTHIATHASFGKEVSRLKTALQSADSSFQVAEKALDFLARWLASHILETDRHMAYVVHAIRQGLPLDAAKVQAREEMAGTTRVLIDIILSTYSTLSSNTLHLMRELAEHRQADEALKQSEARLKFALEGSEDGLWDWNIADNSLFLTYRWKEMLGFDDDEIGTGIDEWEKRIHPDDKADTIATLQAYFDGKVPNYLTEHRVLCKDGSYKWILNRGMAVSRSEDGKPLRMIGTHTDITHRKEAEKKLRSSETLLRATLESTDEGILMIGSQGQVLSANKRFRELWRVPPELAAKGQDELLIAHVLDQLVDPDVFLDLVKRLYGTDEESRDILHFKNGRVFARFTRALFIGNERGRIWCFRDITEQSHAQAALTESNTLLQTVIESTPIRIFWKDKSLRYLGCNTVFARDAGMTSPQDIIGKDDYQMGWSEQAELYRADDRLVMDSFKPKLSFDEQQTTPAGETIWLRTSKVPLFNADNENIGILGTYEDITKRKQNEEELRASEHKLNSILDNVDAYIYLKDTEGRYLFANKPVRELWHAETQDISGYSDEKFFDDQTATNIRSNDSRVLKAGETIRWGLLKNELVHHRRFKTRAEAIEAITEYIEIFYKRQRKQARLGYLSPVAFERQFYENRLAA